MALKKYKPTTSSQRHKVIVKRDNLSKPSRIKSLELTLKSKAGRNNQGRITVRHRGGGVKKKYRIIDYKRNKYGVIGRVDTIEYDPNRNAYISLVVYVDGEKRYIITPEGVKIGEIVDSGPEAEIKIGNSLPLNKIPSGMTIHNIEMNIGQGGKLVRSAGEGAVLRGSNGNGYSIVKMPSGEIRLINDRCSATIGNVSNAEYRNVVFGKAGTKRRMGIRPTVRGVAMHAVQHPHGGGEARNGIRMAKDLWGNRLGKKTRKNKRTERFIIKHRISKRNAPGIV